MGVKSLSAKVFKNAYVTAGFKHAQCKENVVKQSLVTKMVVFLFVVVF